MTPPSKHHENITYLAKILSIAGCGKDNWDIFDKYAKAHWRKLAKVAIDNFSKLNSMDAERYIAKYKNPNFKK